MITEAELECQRSSLTLRQRVDARRALDAEAGIVYPPLTDTAAARLVGLLTVKENI